MQARDARGRTALHLAARSGHVALCQVLVRLGGLSLEETDKDGDTPLALAQRNDKRTRANVTPAAIRQLQELLRETRTSYGAFLSHCKGEPPTLTLPPSSPGGQSAASAPHPSPLPRCACVARVCGAADAEGTARTLKEYLGAELAQNIFLDSDNLRDLSALQEHVRNSQALRPPSRD